MFSIHVQVKNVRNTSFVETSAYVKGAGILLTVSINDVQSSREVQFLSEQLYKGEQTAKVGH